MKKPIVGQIVFSLNIGNAARNREQKLTPMLVTRVGTKRFYCVPQEHQGFRETAFFLSDWSHDNKGYFPDHRLYETEQAWLDSKEAKEIVEFIRDCFEYGLNKRGLPLASLRAIRDIIESNQDDHFRDATKKGKVEAELNRLRKKIGEWADRTAECSEEECGKTCYICIAGEMRREAAKGEEE